MNTELSFTPVPHAEAMAIIAGKPAITRDVFDKLLPELRGRSFTISGVTALDVLQNARDAVASLPAGGDWNKIKKGLVHDISPYLVDPDADPAEQAAQMQGANRRAELLLRTHGFQAYQAAQWNVIQRQRDVFPYLRYVTMEDESVRPAHAALDGKIIPVNSPFWLTHFPPWDWGCRCQAVPVSQMAYDQVRKGEAGLKPHESRIIDGGRLRLLEQRGELDMGNGRFVNVTTPKEKAEKLPPDATPEQVAKAKKRAESAFSWNPGDLRIPLDELKGRYDPDIWAAFVAWAQKQMLARDVSVWDWLRAGAKIEDQKPEGIA